MDTTFSGDGKLTLPTTGAIGAMVYGRNGDIIALVGTALFKVTAAGKLNLSYGGGDGQVNLPEAGRAMAINGATGVLYLLAGECPEQYLMIVDGENVDRRIEEPFSFAAEDGRCGDGGVDLTTNGSFVWVVGQALESTGEEYFPHLWDSAIVRYRIDTGVHIDDRFGVDGIARSGEANFDRYLHGYDIAVDPATGRLAVAGYVAWDECCQDAASLQWFNPNGSLLSSGGVNVGDGGFDGDYFYGVIIKSGKAIAVGEDDQEDYERQFLVARFKQSGLLDTTFGRGEGFVVTPGAPDVALDVGMYGAKIVAAGGRYITRYQGS